MRPHNQILLPGSQLQTFYGRHTGLVSSELDARLRGLGLSPGCVIVLCSWAKHFILIVPLYIREYKWVLANCQGRNKEMFGENLGMDWHPIQEGEREVQILLVVSRHRNLPAELATCLKYRLNLLPQTIHCIS